MEAIIPVALLVMMAGSLAVIVVVASREVARRAGPRPAPRRAGPGYDQTGALHPPQK
jgi:hypothetical protein